MKTLKLLSALLFVFCFTATTTAQTAEEIIENYLENIGGSENWNKVEALKITANANQGGMEIPVELTQLSDGRTATVLNIQGQTVKQNVFDGETLWNTNMMSQKAEKSSQEDADNAKQEAANFPDPFLNYKAKGFSIEFMGKEDFEGSETLKVKLTMKPKMIDGKQEDNISYYFFDTENFVPIAMQTEIKSGQAKGMTTENTFSDYQEVDGLYFPFAITFGTKGQPGLSVTIEKYEINPEVDEAVFMFPKEEVATPTDKKN